MILTGISDEAGNSIDAQIRATQELGWHHLEMRGVEVPGFPKANFHDLPDQAFNLAAEKLQAAGIQVYCFGSTVMNWAKRVTDPFDITLQEVRRCLPRMRRLGTRFVRIMSFKPGDDEAAIPTAVFERVREVTKLDQARDRVRELIQQERWVTARADWELALVKGAKIWVDRDIRQLFVTVPVDHTH